MEKIYRRVVFSKLKFYINELENAADSTEKLIWGNKLDGYISALTETDFIPFKWWRIISKIAYFHRYNEII